MFKETVSIVGAALVCVGCVITTVVCLRYVLKDLRKPTMGVRKMDSGFSRNWTEK
jgi:hypothetical protein